MGETMKFDYYYGLEAEQFSFYRIPRLLIRDEHFRDMTNDAKLLYGLMLDRMGISMKNDWQDEDGRTFIIYSVDAVAEDINCARDKAMKVMNELISIGLIEKVRRGQGKPDIIYVKNFAGYEESGMKGKEPKYAEVEEYIFETVRFVFLIQISTVFTCLFLTKQIFQRLVTCEIPFLTDEMLI